VGTVIADVVAQLLQAAQRREVADGVDEDRLAAERDAGRDAGHVLLGNADVAVEVRKAPGDRLQHRIAKITAQQPYVPVLGGHLLERGDEGVSHAPTSFSAASSWSPEGEL